MYFSENPSSSIVFDQWESILSNLKHGLSRLRAHIYENREEYTSVIISYSKEKHIFAVVSFTVGRARKSAPWDVKHYFTEYPVLGCDDAQRNEAVLRIIANHNVKEDIKYWISLQEMIS